MLGHSWAVYNLPSSITQQPQERYYLTLKNASVAFLLANFDNKVNNRGVTSGRVCVVWMEVLFLEFPMKGLHEDMHSNKDNQKESSKNKVVC